MAYRALSSDSEDDYFTPTRSTKATRSKRVIDEDADDPDIDSFSSSSVVYSEPESTPNESVSPEVSPLQVTQKKKTNQRIIISDEEEDTSFLTSTEAGKPKNKDIKTRTNAPAKRNEAIKNAGVVHANDGSEDSDINSFSSSSESTSVISASESNPNESVSLSQVTQKRRTNQRVATSEEEEADPSFSISKEAATNEHEDTRMMAPVNTNKGVINSSDEAGDDLDSSSSESGDAYSELESNINESASPLHMTQKRTLHEKVIISDDEQEDPSFSPTRKPAINIEMGSTRSGELDRDEVKTSESQLLQREVNGNKENTTPPSNNSPPEKPLIVPVLGTLQTKPTAQMQGLPSKKPPQVMTAPHKAPTYPLAHTRQALLKQLDYVKGLKAKMGEHLPDKGANLARWEKQIVDRITSIKGGESTMMEYNKNKDNVDRENAHQGGWAKNRILAQQYKHLTYDAVEQLHSAMQSRPESQAEVDNPKELKTSLMPHQRRALAWALWRETQTPSGGILADDMGLGKTLTMLSLILAARGESSGPTLVVCPASLMQQWDGEVTNHVRAGRLKVLIYHSDGRKIDPQRLSQHDVVITTYGVIGSEGASYLPDDTGKKPKRKAANHYLFDVQWNRIVLDEGHTIKNPKTNAALGVCALSSRHRWVLTGTPVHNSLKDVYSLVKFLKLAPFNDFTVWKEMVQKKSVGMQRLQTLMQSLLLRRTKEEIGDDGRPLIKLPSKQVINHSVMLNEDEQCVFNLLFVQCRSRFLDYLRDLKEGGSRGGDAGMEMPPLPSHLSSLPSIMSRLFGPLNNTAVVLVTILRLLQCSCHLGLLGKAMEVDQQEVDQLETRFASMSLTNPGSSSDGVDGSCSAQGELPKCFSVDVSSSKVNALLGILKDVFVNSKSDRSPKCVVVSQWTSYLDIIEKHIRKVGFTFVRIDGSVPPKKRNALVEEFNSQRSHPQLLLMTLKTGGVGLNLTRGSHLFLMDLHWNPALEQQAADRIHRLGQIMDVTIHRFLCEKTAEEKIVQIQESKKKLATDVLSCTTGAGSKNKLTLEDLKLLFSI